MATKTQTQTENQTEVNKPARTFSFTPTVGIAIPDNLHATRESQLPFRAAFSAGEADAIAKKQPHIFVPLSYFVEERNVAADKATPAYVRAKVRDQFKSWQEEPSATPARLTIVLPAVNRTGNEGIEGITEPGVSFWLDLKK